MHLLPSQRGIATLPSFPALRRHRGVGHTEEQQADGEESANFHPGPL
ncbi:hypothetical protein PSMK_00610 [Phycisphaera mikurensis NBRC 102666]|uniref:Uncharacterized protein n=1 Tax=Phycisphaera mikurensis (strain NBRC 102666 / KCTC 22515 / FYK2301M01) TaxID=1142394 RepID=I0IAD2_PHYMF|nr:hypothetical protein PSMK_00610 [Phycisphaera mikurensis NBRC 102666]